MNAHLIPVISRAVEQLIELIQDVDDDNPPVEVDSIHINDDIYNNDTHLVVWAEVRAGERPGVAYPYKYAIYINKEDGRTGCDGY